MFALPCVQRGECEHEAPARFTHAWEREGKRGCRRDGGGRIEWCSRGWGGVSGEWNMPLSLYGK
ncbi:hypothetical protein E2C01_078714 [Portunus trituberculatus]|uniref:Uncharacterized protein n=1 Tax=Portunus trituberculatus TaxID=210409 RepID=A0A5B7IHL3_PORTR|nr:hypothetical protein [Portunus trituberculatus]